MSKVIKGREITNEGENSSVITINAQYGEVSTMPIIIFSLVVYAISLPVYK